MVVKVLLCCTVGPPPLVQEIGMYQGLIYKSLEQDFELVGVTAISFSCLSYMKISHMSF